MDMLVCELYLESDKILANLASVPNQIKPPKTTITPQEQLQSITQNA